MPGSADGSLQIAFAHQPMPCINLKYHIAGVEAASPHLFNLSKSGARKPGSAHAYRTHWNPVDCAHCGAAAWSSRQLHTTIEHPHTHMNTNPLGLKRTRFKGPGWTTVNKRGAPHPTPTPSTALRSPTGKGRLLHAPMWKRWPVCTCAT